MRPGFFLALLISLVSDAVAAPAIALNPKYPTFPQEVFTFEMIAEKIRLPITDKISEIRMTYRMVERPAGPDAARLEFLDGAESPVMRIYFERSMNSARSERMEEVLVQGAGGAMLFKETVFTRGQDLEYSNPNQRIFFEANTSNYGLKENETEKTAVISIDGAEQFRFYSSEIPSRSQARLQFSEMYYGGSRGLRITDSVSQDGSIRQLRYQVLGTTLPLNALGVVLTGSGDSYEMITEAERKRGYLLENHRFYLEGVEIFGLNNFAEQFSRQIFDPFVTRFANRFLTGVINANFPASRRRANLATVNRFLDEIIDLRSQLLLIAANPAGSSASLTRITMQINGYIDAFQNGTLSVTDTRPAQ